MKYKYNPVLFNKMFQGQEGYIGVDNLKNSTLKNGKLIVALEMPNGGGNYFLPLDEFKKYNLDVTALCQGVQVSAWYDEISIDDIARYKPTARLYVVNLELKIAIGNTTANPQYGPGGVTQILVPHALKITKTAYKNFEIPDYTKHPPLIPVDLNNYKPDSRFSSDTQFKLEEISYSYKDNINKKDGYIDLNNKDIYSEVYIVMYRKRIVHEQIVIHNCLMKEYTDELKNPKMDLKYTEELKVKLYESKMDLDNEKDILDDRIIELRNTPDLLRGMSKENIEHLLNSENCCPKSTLEQKSYLENKLQFLENNLSMEEKIKLNIDISEKKDSTELFKIVASKEQGIKEMYIDVTRESDPEVKALDHRQLVYTPNVDSFKRELLCNLKAKDNLNAIDIQTDDSKVKKICSEKLMEVNNNLEKVEGKIASRGIIDKTTFDEKIDYLKLKVKNLQRYLPENKLLNDENKEKQVNELSMDIPESNKIAGCKSLNTINEFCDISSTVIAEEIEIREMSKIYKQIDILENDSSDLAEIKCKLETIDKYKPIVEKYNQKKSFKKAYENEHINEISKYNRAEKHLESKGITNWEQYNKAKEIHNEKEKELENKISIHSKITNTSAIDQRLELSKSKKKQREFIIPRSKEIITKVVSHKKELSLEL